MVNFTDSEIQQLEDWIAKRWVIEEKLSGLDSGAWVCRHAGQKVVVKPVDHSVVAALRAWKGKGSVQIQEVVALPATLPWPVLIVMPCLKSTLQDIDIEQYSRFSIQVVEKLRRAVAPGALETVQEHVWYWQTLTENIDDVWWRNALNRSFAIAKQLLDRPCDICLLHGDLHASNIMIDQGQAYSIDPAPLAGPAAYDVEGLLRPIIDCQQADILGRMLEQLGQPRETLQWALVRGSWYGASNFANNDLPRAATWKKRLQYIEKQLQTMAGP